MKFADDTYLLVGSRHIHVSTAEEEFNNISVWAARNNLKLNALKTKELIIHKRPPSRASSHALPVIQGAERVSSMRVLGVVLNSKLTMVDHLDHLLTTSSVHALRMLRTHGLPQQQLNVVAFATTMASLLYASPAWWGYTSANDRARIDRLISRLTRGGYLPTDHPCFEELANKADQRLFKAISTNKNHVLAKKVPTGNKNHWS